MLGSHWSHFWIMHPQPLAQCSWGGHSHFGLCLCALGLLLCRETKPFRAWDHWLLLREWTGQRGCGQRVGARWSQNCWCSVLIPVLDFHLMNFHTNSSPGAAGCRMSHPWALRSQVTVRKLLGKHRLQEQINHIPIHKSCTNWETKMQKQLFTINI